MDYAWSLYIIECFLGIEKDSEDIFVCCLIISPAISFVRIASIFDLLELMKLELICGHESMVQKY